MKAVVVILLFVAVMLIFWLVLPIQSDGDRVPYGRRAQLHIANERASTMA